MAKSYSIILLITFFNFSVIAQTKIHRVPSTRYHKMTGQYEKAISQLGVIGNDFYNEIRIGNAPATRQGVGNNWYPIDEYKRTAISSLLFAVYKLEDGGFLGYGRDKDYNFELIENNAQIGSTIFAANKQIFAEINVVNTTHPILKKYSDNMPKAHIDNIGVFGPFVQDDWHSDDGSARLEIHPCEQLWWREKMLNKEIYHLYSFMDNSGWFDDLNDFISFWSNGLYTWRAWIPDPMTFTFALPFSLWLKGMPYNYTISTVGSHCVKARNQNAKTHHLRFGSRKIISVTEPPGTDVLDIQFENVGLNKHILLNQGDSVVQGFLVIKSRLYHDGCATTIQEAISYKGADLLLKVVKEKSHPVSSTLFRSNYECKLRVTLNSISCTGVDDENDTDEEIFGYIGVKAYDPAEDISNTLPINSSSSLLWSMPDHPHLIVGENQIIQIDSSFIYGLSNGARLVLVADLNENDSGGDANTTIRDENDDLLEQECDETDQGRCNKGVAYKPVRVSELQLNTPEQRIMRFGSGGSHFIISFTIELLEKNAEPEILEIEVRD